MVDIQDEIHKETARWSEAAERQGFDACLAMLCSMGHVDMAVSVINETERRLPGFKARRDGMRVKCDLNSWPELYATTTTAEGE